MAELYEVEVWFCKNCSMDLGVEELIFSPTKKTTIGRDRYKTSVD